MARHFDFPGGIHPPQRKSLSKRVPLRQAPLPSRVVLPLGQHIGTAAEPTVRVGQHVRTGEPIARSRGLISAPVHASISGTVSTIEPLPIPHPSGETALCIVIEGDGRDERLTLPRLIWRESDDESLIERLHETGIVGLGGAGFPTAVKARVRERHAIDTLIVNAAECEPYITADDLTLRYYANDVLEGARLFARLSGAARIMVGIEDDKPEAASALQAAIDASMEHAGPVGLRVIPTRYPSGGEKQLIKLLTDREVPSHGLPADIGVLCHNPGTLLAAIRAVRDGEPLISRIVTLTGAALARPGNVEARLGTPIETLLTEAGLHADGPARLIMGGPMMGFTLERLDLPLVKTANCLIAATAEEFPAPPAEQPCIRCGACESVCPASLLPQQLYWFARGREHDKAELFDLFDCIECGACAYVCPSHIPLVQYYRAAKDEIRLHRHETHRAEHARHRFEFRQARLAREEAEKEAKRQRRAQAVKPRREEASVPALPTAPDEAAPARTGQAGQTVETPTASTSVPQAQVRHLKIAQAAARAAVKKAEKALARASEAGEEGAEQLADLEVQLATAREHLQTAETRLAAAQSDGSGSDTGKDAPLLQNRPNRNSADDTARDKALKQRRIAVTAAQSAQRKALKEWERFDTTSADPQARDAAKQKLARTQANLERARAALDELQTEETRPAPDSPPEEAKP